MSEFTNAETPVPSVQLNQKTIFYGTGAQINSILTYPFKIACCTASGLGFIANTVYQRNANDSSWVVMGYLSATTGDIMYWGGSLWNRLPLGTTGQVLTVSGGLPTWATPTSSSYSGPLVTSINPAFVNFTPTASGPIAVYTGAVSTYIPSRSGICTFSQSILAQFSTSSPAFAGLTLRLVCGTLPYGGQNTAQGPIQGGGTTQLTYLPIASNFWEFTINGNFTVVLTPGTTYWTDFVSTFVNGSITLVNSGVGPLQVVEF